MGMNKHERTCGDMYEGRVYKKLTLELILTTVQRRIEAELVNLTLLP